MADLIAQSIAHPKDCNMMHGTTTNPLRRVLPPRCLTLLTVQQAADYAAVSKQTLRRWIRAGDLRILRADRQIRIDESDLLAYLHRDADLGTTLSSRAVFPMSSEMQQAVAHAMAATGGAEAVPVGGACFGRQPLRPNGMPQLPRATGTRWP
jgi:excisionase family DNA binding protein